MASTINGTSTGSGGLISSGDDSGILNIQTNETTAITIDASQNVTMAGRTTNPTTISVGAATPSTSGAGITFPAAQSASSNANTLDDYEEGTWTPVQGSGLTVVGAFSSSGRYTKVGRLVYISGRLAASTSVATTAGTIMMTGLPFTVAELTAVGVMTNGNIDTFGGVGVFSTTAYSTTTIGATVAIDFNVTYSV
jgi:hypothetical protein